LFKLTKIKKERELDEKSLNYLSQTSEEEIEGNF
jgi:hypothetical protein